MKFLGLLYLVVCLTANGEEPTPQRLSIETYGDSLTAGFLSGTDVTHAPELPVISKILSDMAMFLVTHDPAHIAAHHRPDLAWPEWYAKMAQAEGVSAQVKNLAVSGARVADLLSQVSHARQERRPSVAFFFIGHNDLCHDEGTPEALANTFESEYRKALARWEADHENAAALILPMGDVHRVYPLLDGYVWHDGNSNARYTCNESWTRFFPYCSAHYKKFKAGTLDKYLVPRLNAVHSRLKNLALELNARTSKNHYAFVEPQSEMEMRREDFAVDCYHLSEAGQRQLAKEVFELTYPVR